MSEQAFREIIFRWEAWKCKEWKMPNNGTWKRDASLIRASPVMTSCDWSLLDVKRQTLNMAVFCVIDVMLVFLHSTPLFSPASSNWIGTRWLRRVSRVPNHSCCFSSLASTAAAAARMLLRDCETAQCVHSLSVMWRTTDEWYCWHNVASHFIMRRKHNNRMFRQWQVGRGYRSPDINTSVSCVKKLLENVNNHITDLTKQTRFSF